MTFEWGLEDEVGGGHSKLGCMFGDWLGWVSGTAFPVEEAEDGMVSSRPQGQSRELVGNPMFKGHHVR